MSRLTAADRVGLQLLADAPRAAAGLVQLFRDTWPEWYGAGGPGHAERDLDACMNRAALPLALVAIDGMGQPLGTAALKQHSIASHTHLSPWLTALVVAPHARNRGIASRLCRGIEVQAANLGMEEIYCATSSACGLLMRLGWRDTHDRTPPARGADAILSKKL